MNKYLDTDISKHLMQLLQLGANVQVVSGKTVYVKFMLDSTLEVSYVYHMNKNNKFFLERIKPYPLPIKEYDSASDVINIILIDYEQYLNAVKSKNISYFIDIQKDLHHTLKAFEDLFLYYNLNYSTAETIKKHIDEIKQVIETSCTECNRVYFTKEPENL